MTLRWWLEVVDPGPLTTVQDLGRPGWAHLGVAPSGVLDRDSAGLANRLVGNPESAAVLESTLVGPRLRLVERTARAETQTRTAGVVRTNAPCLRVAVTGAEADVDIDGVAVYRNAALLLSSGQTLQVGTARRGVRSYVAVAGGVAVGPTLGSRSADLLSGLGPAALERGDQLPVGELTGTPAAALDYAPTPAWEPHSVLNLVLGPRHDWFDQPALDLVSTGRWTVSPQSNRVGLRLTGPRLTRQRQYELPPEGLMTGSLQVPPDGQPVLFLADHPTTGGYPVIGVVNESSLPAAAQAAPGSTISFRTVRPRLPVPGA